MNFFDEINSVDDLPIGIMQLSKENEIVWVNNECEQILGEGLFKVIHKKIDEIFIQNSYQKIFSQRILEAQSNQGIIKLSQFELITQKGKKLLLNIKISRKQNHYALLILEDVYNDEQQRRKLLTYRHYTGVSRMAETLAHDIKNPLSSILGAVQLLRDEDERLKDHLLMEIINAEGHRIKRLLDKLSSLAVNNKIQFEPVNIHKLLDQVLRGLNIQLGGDIEFIKRYDPSLPDIYGNPDCLHRIFDNLIRNACEALDKNRINTITLVTSYRLDSPLSDGHNRHLPLEIKIIDNGVGIPENRQENIFEPYVTTKPNGSGLGLAIVHKLVGELGGNIELESRSGYTCFTLCFQSVIRKVENLTKK